MSIQTDDFAPAPRLVNAAPESSREEALERALPRLLGDFGPDLILYQAGVDVHADDRLGRLALTDAGLEAREALVMQAARRRGIALASTLGGGYAQGDAARMELARRHARSLAALAKAAS